MLAALALCLLAFSGERARAEYTVIEVNFIMADKNGDLLISKPEYLLVAIDDFNKLDLNQNNLLDPDEIGDLADDPEYLDGDSDKSGTLSVEEVITEKLADFDAADTNKDGALNVGEVTAHETK
jgi:EF hand